jgi:hypothetical protein
VKQDFGSASRDGEMQIDWSDEQEENAKSPRHKHFEPDSNIKSEKVWQQVKQYAEILSIDEGIQIAFSAEQRCTEKNNPRKLFQLMKEYKSIGGMNKKKMQIR